jgi:hypothetical protein
MRRLTILLAILTALPLFGGVRYHFSQETTGQQQASLSGDVEADGPRLRMDIVKGDRILFKDDSIALSDDGGKTLTVIDPAAKTYYLLKLDDFLGGMLEQLKALGSIKFEEPKVDVRDTGAGGTIEGFPTQKAIIDASYTVAISVGGNAVKVPMKLHSEIWRTDKLTASLTPFQMSAVRTGIPALDKMIEQYDKMPKGFPLRQVSKVEVTPPGGTKAMETVSTMNVTGVQQRDIAATEFALPAGLKEVPNPIDAMLRSMK